MTNDMYIKSDIQKSREAEAQRVKRAVRKAKGLCPTCGKYPLGIKTFNCIKCTNRLNTYHQQTRDSVKLAAFNKYGGVICKCCGETEPLLLTIDHINEDGASHRRAIFGYTEKRKGRGTGGNMYRWLKSHNYPEGFQVLCFNCNAGKHLNHGICPHQVVLKKAMVAG